MKSTAVLRSLTFLSLCLPCFAQESGGPLMGAPVAVATPSGIEVKLSGFADVASPVGGSGPDFAAISDAIRASGLQIQAMSLGIDVINVDTTIVDGHAIPAFSDITWVALMFSVNPEEIDATEATEIADRIGAEGDAMGRTVFSYVLPGSDLDLVPPEVDTIRALGASELGLTSSEEIAGLNIHIALYGLDASLGESGSSGVISRPLLAEPTLYFTLDKASVDKSKAAAMWDGAPSSATILKVTWNSSTSNWSAPSVYRKWSEIHGLSSSDSIDGLAIDDRGSTVDDDDFVLFSLSKLSSDSDPHRQLLFVTESVKDSTDGKMRVLQYSVLSESGDPEGVGEKLGTAKAVGDFCVVDPTLPQAAGTSNVDEYVVGGRERRVGGRRRLWVSSFRDVNRAGRPRVRSILNSPIRRLATPAAVTLRVGIQRLIGTGATARWSAPTWGDPIPMTYSGRAIQRLDLIPRRFASVNGTRRLVYEWTMVRGTDTFIAPYSVVRL